MRKKQGFSKKMGAVLLAGAMMISLLTGIPAREMGQAQAATTLNNPQTDSNGVVTWDCVYFGRYPQSDAKGNTKDPIKWRVLSVDGNDALLFADKNLDVHEYHYAFVDTTWETSTVRSWLNGYGYTSNNGNKDFTKTNFIDRAFTAEEQNAILTTTVVNQDIPEINSENGNDTEDKLFLLELKDMTSVAYGHSKSMARIRTNTAYVAAGGSNGSQNTEAEGEANSFWLRTMGTGMENANNKAIYVSDIGGVIYAGFGVESDKFAICPALHLDLSNSGLWFYAGTVSSDGSSEEVAYPSKYLKSIGATKVKTSYETGDTLNVDDVTVTAVYSDETEKTITTYTTNASSIDMSSEGKKELVITYTEDGVSKTFVIEIEVTKPDVPEETTKTLESIKAKKVTTSYETGDELKVDDITVTAVYSDGTEQAVTNYTSNVSDINMSLEGKKELVITYTEDGVSKTFVIEIEVTKPDVPEETTKTLESIKAKKVTTSYETGDELKVDDITVTAVYSDGTEQVVTTYTSNVSDIDMSSEGKKELVITYTEDGIKKTFVIEIEVTKPDVPEETTKTLESIKATKVTTSYETGDELKVDDITVTAVYSDESEQTVTTYTTNASTIDMSVEGTKELVITYEEGEVKKTTVIQIKVTKRNVQSETTTDVDKNQQEEEAKSDKTTSEEDKSEDSVLAENIKITGVSKKIAVGSKIKLVATVTPSDVTNAKVKWSSSNIKYATVNQKGQVSINKKGAGKQVTITASAMDGSGKKATYKIKIMKHAVKKVSIKGNKTQTVKAGRSLKLKTTIQTTGKSVNKTLKWTSDNVKYATVTQNGVVKTKKAGKGKKVKITASATDGSNKKATVTIKIK